MGFFFFPYQLRKNLSARPSIRKIVLKAWLSETYAANKFRHIY